MLKLEGHQVILLGSVEESARRLMSLSVTLASPEVGGLSYPRRLIHLETLLESGGALGEAAQRADEQDAAANATSSGGEAEAGEAAWRMEQVGAAAARIVGVVDERELALYYGRARDDVDADDKKAAKKEAKERDEQRALPVVVGGPEAPERADGLLARLGKAADVVDYGLLEPERLRNCVIIIIESERAPEE